MIENTQTIVMDDDTEIEATFQMNVSSGGHDMLDHRDFPDQHPMSAITGLESALESKVDKTTEANKVYGTDENGDQTTYNVDSFGKVDDVTVGGVSVVTNKIAELGTMAGETATDYYTKTETDDGFATAEQGAKADTAIQPLDNITELTNNAGYITASAVKDGTLTIQKNGTLVSTFTANQEGNSTANLLIPTNAADVGALPDSTTIADLTTTAQLAALNSGATSTNIAQIATNTGDISIINGKIPSAATTTNQLADKDFVNSSIATNTANFIGTFNSIAELEAYSGTVTNNDYAFVTNSVVTDNGNDWADLTSLNAYDKTLLTNFDYAWVINGSKFDLYRFDIVNQVWELRVQNTDKADVTLNTAYNRYKASVSGSTVTWDFEYTLNNSSFTAQQWAAINSGANDTNIAQITTNQNAIGTLSSLNTTVKTDLVSAVNEVEGVASTALQPNDNISSLTNDSRYITGINSSDVTTALGYTPADSASLAAVATSGSYNDLSNKPTIPTTTNSVTSGSAAALTSGGAYTALQGYANTSLSNLSSNGQMIIDSHNGAISNCVLEIPQNLNVSIASNVVTLAGGSVVTLTGSTYATYTLTAAQTYTISGLSDGKYYLFTNYSGVIQAPVAVGDVVSASSLPASGNYCYLTSDNLIYQYSSGWSATGLAYPIAMIDVESGVASLDIVFNGAGYIGHHAFVYPNVKLLTPNGYNADGTLKSSLVTTSALQISELSGSNNSIDVLSGGTLARRNFKEVETLDNTWTGAQYVKSENITYLYSGGNYVVRMETPIVSYVYTGTDVTSFTIVQPVKVATIDMLDSKQDTLVSGTSIKTINSTSLLGSGNISLLTSADIANMQTTTNLVTSVSSATTDSQYPSAKLFYDTCGDIETLINAL